MKIAIASMNGESVSNHFGKSPYFLVYEVANNEISNISRINNTFTHHFKDGGQPEHHEHHGMPAHHDHHTLVEGLKGCSVVMAGGMGYGAYNDLTENGFEVIITGETDPATAVRKFLNKELLNYTERLH